VGHENDGQALSPQLGDLVQALVLEARVADGQNLVDEDDLGVRVGGDGKAEANVHARGIVLDGHVDKHVQLGKVDDVIHLATDLVVGQAQDRAVQIDVLPAGEVGMKARPQLQEGTQPAVDLHKPGGGLDDARHELEDGAFAGAVRPDKAHHFAHLDLEAYV